jgi:hypothetical protein
MPSKQSEAVRRRWEAARRAMLDPDAERPDDESWGDLTAEPREVDLPDMTRQAVLRRASRNAGTLFTHLSPQGCFISFTSDDGTCGFRLG